MPVPVVSITKAFGGYMGTTIGTIMDIYVISKIYYFILSTDTYMASKMFLGVTLTIGHQSMSNHEQFFSRFSSSLSSTQNPGKIILILTILIIIILFLRLNPPFFCLHSQLQWQQKRKMGMVCIATDIMP